MIILTPNGTSYISLEKKEIEVIEALREHDLKIVVIFKEEISYLVFFAYDVFEPISQYNREIVVKGKDISSFFSDQSLLQHLNTMSLQRQEIFQKILLMKSKTYRFSEDFSYINFSTV